MNAMIGKAFAELRSLCQRPHNEATWDAILEALKTWPDEETLIEMAVPYATSHLSHWPDHYRNCDEDALNQLCACDVPVYMSVLTRLGNINIYSDTKPGIPGFSIKGLDFDWIVDSPALQSIRSMNLRNHDLGDEELLQLAQSPHLRKLKHLDVGGNPFSAQGIHEFVDAFNFDALEELAIWTTAFDDEAIRRLGNNAAARSLKYLELGETAITSQGMEHLANAEHLQDIEQLFLWATKVDEEGVLALADAPKFKSLRELELQRTNMTLETLQLVTNRETFSNLNWIMLGGHHHLNDSLAYAFAESPYLKKIQRIGLRNTGLSDDGFLAMCKSDNMETIEHLDIAENHLPNACKTIVEQEVMPALRELWVWNTNQHPDSLNLLMDAPHLSELSILYMNQCQMKYNSFKRAFEGRNASRLIELSLGGCNVGSNSVRALAKAPFEQLKYLSLVRNNFGDKGLSYLLNAPYIHTIDTLYLAWNELTDDIIPMLIDSGILENLHTLGIGGNNLTNKGIIEATNHPAFGNLKFFGIFQNNYTNEVYQHIIDSPYLTESAKAPYRTYCDERA